MTQFCHLCPLIGDVTLLSLQVGQKSSSKVPRFNFCDMSLEFCNMSLRFSATCPQHFATFCDTSLSFAIFYDTSQNRKDMSQNRKDMSQVAKDTSQNRKDTSQNFATCQNVLAIFCDIVRHVSDFCDMPHPPPQPPIHSSSGYHVFDEWPKWPRRWLAPFFGVGEFPG